MTITVNISSTSPGVSIGGGTSVSVAVSGTTAPISLSMLTGGSTTLPDITQLEAGDGITITTAAGQFVISSYSTASLWTFAPVSSVNKKTGAVVLYALDLTAAEAIHTHSTASIVGLTAAIGGSAPVLSVAGRTGVITLQTADISGLAAIAASGSASDLTAGTIPAARLPAASTATLGAVKVGSGLTITDGTLSATLTGPALSDNSPQQTGTASAGTSSEASRADHVHAVPLATTTAFGAIKVGSGLSITSGVLSASSATAATSFVSVPLCHNSTGTAGTFAADSSYFYACYSANNWLRVQRAGWICVPTAPTSLSVTADRSASSSESSPTDAISASWQSPANDGGELSGYWLQLNTAAAFTVSANTLTYTWDPVTAQKNSCTLYTVSVQAYNSAGTGAASTLSKYSPNTTFPTGFVVSQTPNEGAPGVTYEATWVPVCYGERNAYEVQYRETNAGNGAEDNWVVAGYPTANSLSFYISTAVSSSEYDWRVRAINRANNVTTWTSDWSTVESTPPT